jgi:hypothetical protein
MSPPSPERSRFCPAPNPRTADLERIMVGDQGLGRRTRVNILRGSVQAGGCRLATGIWLAAS